MVFHWTLSGSKSPQVSRTLFTILADLNNTVVWMVSARPPISSSSIPLTKPSWIVPSALITIGITVTLIAFFVLWQGPSTWLSFRFLWFSFCGPLGRHSSLFSRFSFFSFLARFRYLSLFVFFDFLSMVRRDSKVHYSTRSPFLYMFTFTKFDLLAGMRWSVRISKSQRILCVSFSRVDSGFCIYL